MSTTDCRLVTSNFLSDLIAQIAQAEAMYWLVSFTMVSGVRLLLPALRDASSRGVDIKILTGDYLSVTEPEALSLLIAGLPTAELRFWRSQEQSFHPKAYLFERTLDDHTLFVGSSDWSASALTGGVEWNLMVRGGPVTGIEQFMRVFYSDPTVPLNTVSLSQYRTERDVYHAVHSDSVDHWSHAESLNLMAGQSMPGGEDGMPAAASYQALLQYFAPRFLLGLTATPDRTDGRDIYGLCDGNLVY